MPKMLSEYTDFARARLEDDAIVAAVPIAHPAWQKWALIGGLSFGVGMLLPPPVREIFIVVAGLFVAVILGREYVREPTRFYAGFGKVLAVFFPDRLELYALTYRWSGWQYGPTPKWLGGWLETVALSDVAYVRTRVAVDTRLVIEGTEYTVHGWLERDLRQAIGPLGVDLETLPPALPDPPPRRPDR